MPQKIIWKPNPGPQTDAFLAQTDEVFYGGGRGSGKSSWLYGKVVDHVQRYRGKSKMIFFRENFDDLADLIDKGKDILEEHDLATFVSGQTRTFRFKGPFEGAWLKMRQVEHIDDVKKYKGHEYTLIGFDEICDFKLPFETLHDTFMATLRNPHGIKGQVIYTGNPGGFNHNAVKEYFIDPWPTGRRIIQNEYGQTRVFFQSTVLNNPMLANDENYMRQLETIRDPALRKAWLYGDWNVALGAMFADVWDKTKHQLDFSIMDSDIPVHFPRYRCLDWGSSTPFSYLRYFISTGETLNNGMWFPKGAIVFYAEYYGWQPGMKKNEGLKLSSEQVATEIKRQEVASGYHHLIEAGPADTQIFQVLDGTPIYDSFFKHDIKFAAANKAAGTDAVGCERIRTRLVGYDDHPALFFTRDCVNAIRTIPSLARNKLHQDKLAPYQEDHSFDCVKYVCLAAEKLPDTQADIVQTKTYQDEFLRQLNEED